MSTTRLKEQFSVSEKPAPMQASSKAQTTLTAPVESKTSAIAKTHDTFLYTKKHIRTVFDQTCASLSTINDLMKANVTYANLGFGFVQAACVGGFFAVGSLALAAGVAQDSVRYCRKR